MSNYQIISDSCSDYTQQPDLSWLRRVPLTIQLASEHFLDTEDLDCGALLDKMAVSAVAPHSACPSFGNWTDAFDEAEGDIYVVTLSGALSGSYNSALVAAREYLEEHPGRNIHVFDSRSAASGQIIVDLKIRDLAEQGYPFEEVVKRTEGFIGTMTTLFVLETLDVFRKNGRLSHLQSLAAGALRLKMVMRGTAEGNVEPQAKALSMQQALSKMAACVREKSKNLDLSKRRLAITYVDCEQRAQSVRDIILKDCPFSEVILCRGSGISSMYANRGGIILSY